MLPKFNYKSILILAVLALTLSLVTGSSALAQEGTQSGDARGALPVRQGDRVTVPGGPGFISISPRAFNPGSMTTEWDYYSSPIEEYSNELFNPSDTERGHYFAEVYLPQGATITKLVAYYFDSMSSGLSVFLYRQPLIGGTCDFMAQAPSEGSAGYGYSESTSIFEPIINNQDYVYYIEVDIPATWGCALTLTGVRIDYEYTTYLPTVID